MGGLANDVDAIPRCQTQGKSIRTLRLFGRGDGRLFAVPLDHTVTSGPVASVAGFGRLIADVAGGADAVILHKGQARAIDPRTFRRLSLITHLTAGTVRAADVDSKYLVASVEEALRGGADAVSVHVNLGADDEAAQISGLAAVVEAADRWSVPVLAMMYPRGPRVRDPHAAELVAHAVTVAADLGADVVKTVYTGSVATMAEVVRCSPVPIIAAGGPALASLASVRAYVRDVLAAGVAGVAMGRNVFAAPDPAAVVRAVAALLHPGDPPDPTPTPAPPEPRAQPRGDGGAATSAGARAGRPACAPPSPTGAGVPTRSRPRECR